jgi:hypothetical protein
LLIDGINKIEETLLYYVLYYDLTDPRSKDLLRKMYYLLSATIFNIRPRISLHIIKYLKAASLYKVKTEQQFSRR